MRERLTRGKRWVIKVGSSLLTANGQGLDHQLISQWSAQMAELVTTGHEVVLVSSGSIAEGMTPPWLAAKTHRRTRTTSRCSGWPNGLDSSL